MPEFEAVEELIERFGPYHAAECYATWHDAIETRPNLVYAPIHERIRSGGQMSALDAERVKQGLAETTARLHARIRRAGILLFPTTAIGPSPIADLEADIEAYRAANVAVLRNTRRGNYLGCCALTLLCGCDGNGVPTGLMLMAPPGDDERLLRLGYAMEPVLVDA